MLWSHVTGAPLAVFTWNGTQRYSAEARDNGRSSDGSVFHWAEMNVLQLWVSEHRKCICDLNSTEFLFFMLLLSLLSSHLSLSPSIFISLPSLYTHSSSYSVLNRFVFSLFPCFAYTSFLIIALHCSEDQILYSGSEKVKHIPSIIFMFRLY
jgi:hypothetical protein